jgi:hypothetical protein
MGLTNAKKALSMAIYNIFDYNEKEIEEKLNNEASGPRIDPSAFTSNHIDKGFAKESEKSNIFSALAARFFFFLLLIADVLWGVYSLFAVIVKTTLHILTFAQISSLKKSLGRSFLSLKRAIVSAIALMIAIFSPALGIMFSCMYFLMYDKSGVDEVVPASLRDQFRLLFP